MTSTTRRPIKSAADYDANLIAQARAIAAAKTHNDMRYYLASLPTCPVHLPTAGEDTVRAAFTGNAQAVIAELATMAERLTPKPAPVRLAMFAPDDQFGTPDMFAHTDTGALYLCCPHCTHSTAADPDEHSAPCPEGCNPAPIGARS